MAKISLRTYNREIEGFIEHGQQLDEAIVHCRHILKTFPKHLETYRLLGKAYLEAKRYDQAVDIFQRVLVVTPDDFVSHVGMSIIADDKGKLDDAIWHMERAFEVQPSNAAIQGELQRLFGRRDGVEPPKIRLTRGALAHMYVQGELYNQAISEIRAVLANDPKRTDMQTLLARAYFRNSQKAEATDLCTELLSRFPYCLDANRLMAEILPGTPRADAAQEYRQRVIELDPYAAFVQDSLFHSENVADSLVSLERLEYTGENTEMLGSLGIGLDTDTTLVGRASAQTPEAPRPTSTGGALPSWLSGAADDAVSKPQRALPAEPTGNEGELPEFLRDAGWGAASGSPAPETSSAFSPERDTQPPADSAVEGDLPAWVKALAPADEEQLPSEPIAPTPQSDAFPDSSLSRSVSADTPDWLRNLGEAEALPPTPSVPESPVGVDQNPSFSAETPDWLRNLGPSGADEVAAAPAEPAEETPDWLKDLGGRELDEPAAPSKPSDESDWLGDLRADSATTLPPEPAPEESPDWLKDFSNDLETPIAKQAPVEPSMPQPINREPSGNLGSLGTTAQEQDDAMAWLEGLAAKHGAKPEELVTDPNARTEVAPDWVDKAKEIGEPGPEAVQPASEDETGMWLRSLETDVTSAVRPSRKPQEPEEQEPLDFRSSFADQNDFSGVQEESDKDAAPSPEEPETPDWLSEFGAKPAARRGMDDAPDWLRGMSEEPVVPELPLSTPLADKQAPTEPLSKTPQAGDLPSEAQPAEEGVSDLPGWLAGLDKEETNIAEATRGQGSDGLPSWLQTEAEPEPEAKQPANPADWRPVQPEQSEMGQPVVETKSAAAKSPPPAPPEVRRVEKSPITARPKPVSLPSKAPSLSLGDAQSQLGRGNIAAALDIYGKLIRKGKSLEDIIRDLRDALYRYPVEVPLWQSLGDAYMRANRLQEALDAYTKAEELLR